MQPALFISKTGVIAQDQRQSVTANNLANVNTNGFKKDRINFSDLPYQNRRQAGGLSSQNTNLPTGLTIGTGVKAVSTQKDHSLGNIIVTEQPLDAAINGRGYFQLLLPDGTVGYTRDGQLKLDQTGQIVDTEGNPLQPAVTISSETVSITIGSDGVVSTVDSTGAQAQVGNIQLANFPNPIGLEPVGNNLFKETVSSGAPVTSTPGLNGVGDLKQGALESSNVNIVEEMVDMITTQRAFEVNTKSIEKSDQMLSYLNQNVG